MFKGKGKKWISLLAAVAISSSVLIATPVLGSTTDASNDWDLTKVESALDVTGSERNGYTIQFTKKKQSAKLKTPFADITKEKFQINSKINYFGGQVWTSLTFHAEDGTTQKVELVSQPQGGEAFQEIIFIDGEVDRVSKECFYQMREGIARPYTVSFVQEDGHWYMQLCRSSGTILVIKNYTFDNYVGQNTYVSVGCGSNAEVETTFTSSSLQAKAKGIGTGEWTSSVPNARFPVTVGGDAANGYDFDLVGEKATATLQIPMTDLKNQTIKFIPFVHKNTMFSPTKISNFTLMMMFSPTPDITGDDVRKVGFTFVPGSENVHCIAFGNGDVPNETLTATLRNFYNFDNLNKGNVLTFKESEDGHLYPNIFVDRVGDVLFEPEGKALKESFQMDKISSGKVYVSFSICPDAESTPMNIKVTSDVAATAATASAAAVSEVNAAIEALPAVGALTLANQDAVGAANAKLTALADNNVFVKTVNTVKLSASVVQMQKLTDEKSVADVNALIDALPAAADLTLENYQQYSADISAAKTALSNLGALSSQVDATRTTKINELVATLGELDSDYAAKVQAAAAFDAQVAALGAVGDISVENYADKKAAIDGAKAAYTALDPTVSSLVKETTVTALGTLEARLPQVKKAVDVQAAILALPAVAELKLSDESAVSAATKAYNDLLADKTLIVESTLKMLTDAQAKILELQKSAGDWYINNPDYSYQGNAKDGWSFDDSRSDGNKVIATSIHDYDMTKTNFLWHEPHSGSSGWILLGLTTDVSSSSLPSPEDKTAFSFILRPISGGLNISYFHNKIEDPIVSEDITSTSTSLYTNFDFDALHDFTFVKKGGHWYLKIDTILFDGKFSAAFDEYMEANGAKTKVRIGGDNGFRATLIQLIDNSENADSKDWALSNTLGKVSGNATDGYEISFPSSGAATMKNPIKNAEEYEFSVNFNTDITCWSSSIGFLKALDISNNPAKGEGVIVRFINRPNDADETHILVYIKDKWETVMALKPATGNTALKMTIEKDLIDDHYYLYANDEQIKFGDYAAELNEYIWMDQFAGNHETFLRIGGDYAVEPLNASVFFKKTEGEGTDTEKTPTQLFVALLEQHFDAASAGDKAVLTLLATEWAKLDYFTQQDVEASVIDDEGMNNLLAIVKSYTVTEDSDSSQEGSPEDSPATGTETSLVIVLLMVVSFGAVMTIRKTKAKN